MLRNLSDTAASADVEALFQYEFPNKLPTTPPLATFPMIPPPCASTDTDSPSEPSSHVRGSNTLVVLPPIKYIAKPDRRMPTVWFRKSKHTVSKSYEEYDEIKNIITDIAKNDPNEPIDLDMELYLEDEEPGNHIQQFCYSGTPDSVLTMLRIIFQSRVQDQVDTSGFTKEEILSGKRIKRKKKNTEISTGDDF